jgi:hypothetical protein
MGFVASFVLGACAIPGPFSNEASGSWSSALDASDCGTARENRDLTLSCPDGQIIQAIVFASYGTPEGACGSLAKGACDAANTTEIVRAECEGQAACTVGADNGVFGDPCEGTNKTLSVQVTCAAPGGSSKGAPAPAPAPPAPPSPGSPGTVYLGEYPGAGPCTYPEIEKCVAGYEQLVGKKMAIIHAFSDFDAGWDDWFSRIIASGHTLMLTLNPQKAIPDILAGSYDAALQRWGSQIKANGKGTVLVRYLHEMNLPDNPAGWMATHYGAADYIAAYRHVHDQLIAGGGTNIQHLWVPNVFWGDANASNPIWFAPYYPGDDYVDWVGLDGYPMSPSDSFDNQFGPSLALLEGMTQKPIVIAEYGVEEMTPVGTWKANWFTDFLDVALPKHPRVRAIIYQEGTDGGTDHRLETSSQPVTAFANGIAAPRYLSTFP